MNHNNNWNLPAADQSQHSAGPVAFYDPNQFIHSQGNSPAVQSAVHRPFIEQDPSTALENTNESTLQSGWNDQWNYSGNVENNWQDYGVADQPQDSVGYQGAYGHTPYQQVSGHLGATDGHWTQDNLGGNGYDASGYSQSIDQYAEYPNNTGAYYDPQMYGMQPPNLQHSISTHSHNSFPDDGYADQFLQSPGGGGENVNESFEQQDVHQSGSTEKGIAMASRSEAVNGNLEDVLPKVNSFEASLYQPSPFDDIMPGITVAQTESNKMQDFDPTHSRNSSSGGVHFLIGGSENTSGCPSNADSPFGFLREQVVPKISSLADSEHADELVLPAAESSSASFEIVAADTHNPMCTPTKSLALHSTMAGTPAGNQFRIRKPDVAGSNGRFNSGSNDHQLHTSSAPLSKSSVARPDANLFVNNMHSHGHSKIVDPNDQERSQSGLHCAGDYIGMGNTSTENYHQMHIHSSPMVPPQESSFIPVESASDHSIANPSEVMASALEHESTASDENHLDADEIENDALRDSGHIEAACVQQKGNERLIEEFPVAQGSPQKTAVEVSSSRTNFNPHRLRQEATLSPATTLWENPEPAGVQLLPTISAGVSDAVMHDQRSSLSGFLQNTGTGPSRTLNTLSQVEPSIAIDPHITQIQDTSLFPASKTAFSAESTHFGTTAVHDEKPIRATGLESQPLPHSSLPPLPSQIALPGSTKLPQADQYLEDQMSSNSQPYFVSPFSPVTQASTQSSEALVKQRFPQPNSSHSNPASNYFQAPVAPNSDTIEAAALQARQTDNLPNQSLNHGQGKLKDVRHEPVAPRYSEEASTDKRNMQGPADDRRSIDIERVKNSTSRDNLHHDVNPTNRQSSERIVPKPGHQSYGQQYFQNSESPNKILDGSQPVNVEQDNYYKRSEVRSDNDQQQMRPDSSRPNYQQGYRNQPPQSRQGDSHEKAFPIVDSNKPDFLQQGYERSEITQSKQRLDDPRYDRDQPGKTSAEYSRQRSQPNDPYESVSRRGHEDQSLGLPQSRRDDLNNSLSLQRGYEDQSFDRSRSRQEDPYTSGPRIRPENQLSDRPQSRQEDPHRNGPRRGLEDQSFGRPQSRQEDPNKSISLRRGYEDQSFDTSRSRQEDPYTSRPRMRQEDQSSDRPQSRQEDPYRNGSRRGPENQSSDRPQSRQEDPYRNGSRRGPENLSSDRPQSRQEDPYRNGSRRGPENLSSDRPQSRQEDPHKSRPRREYEDQLLDRPRSRQEDLYKSGSRRGYDDQSFDRPRSRLDEQNKGGPRREYDDPHLDPRSRQGPHSRHAEQDLDARYRPRSRQDYPEEPDRNYRNEGHTKRPLSRRDLPDDGRMPNRHRFGDEDQMRPRSRQDDRLSTSGDHHSTRHQRGGVYDRPDYRGGYGYHGDYSYDENSYQAYYQGYPRDYYSEAAYFEYMSAYDPYRFNKGYYSELGLPYSQPYPYDPRYNVGHQSNVNSAYEQVSRHSSTRASVEDLSAADHFAKTSMSGSRPSSVLSGGVPSVISNAHDQSYGDYEVEESFQHSYPVEEVVIPQRLTPHKYFMPHMRISFGSANRLIRILPNNPLNGQPALLEIIDFAELVADTDEARTLKQFPGPLVRVETHKNDVLHHCQEMTSLCRISPSFVDRQSAELLWRFLELLIKQNGTLIGTDIADLLLEGHESTSQSYSRAVMPRAESDRQLSIITQDIDSADQSICVSADRSMINYVAASSDGSFTDRFRHLLLHGHKKDALEWAMKKNLWGHALFLASKMDPKTHASVLTRFANVSMKMNDPLQTLYQIMSGRQPAAATLSADEKWGDWRPHLSIILSNPTPRPELDRKSIVTLGDALASRGLLYSSHFCYLVVSMMMSRDDGNFNGLFGSHGSKSSKMVLIGANHSVPFEEFMSNLNAIQCTEVYEYSMSLGNPQFILPSFQLYRFLYLIRLVDNGLIEEALRYIEVLSRIITYNPQIFLSTMARSVYQLAEKLRYCDPQRMMSEETGDPEWMQHLLSVIQAMENGQVVYQQQQSFPGLDNSMAGQQSTYATGDNAETPGNVSVVSGYQQSTGVVQAYQASVPTALGNMGYTAQCGVEPSAGFQPYMPGGAEKQTLAYTEQSNAVLYSNVTVSAESTTAFYSQQGQHHVSTTPGQSPGILPDNKQPGLIGGYGTVAGQQTAWNNQYQRLQSVPESSTTDGIHVDQGFQEFGVHVGTTSAIAFGAGTSASQGMTYFDPSSQAFNAPPSVSQVPQIQRSLSRQRTLSSSSSNHSYNVSRRGSLVNSTHENSPANTPPASGQASTESSPRGASLNAAGSVSGGDDLFQFGVPPPPSQAYTFDGTNSPLGVNLEQKKKQYWPGEEHDDGAKNDKKSSGSIGKPKDNSGWFSSWFANRKNRPKEMILPDDKNPSIVWDPVKNRYVDKNEDSAADGVNNKERDLPPPTDSEVQQKLVPPAAASVGGQNVPRGTFNRPKVRGARGQYVDVLGSNAKPASAPSNLFSVLPKSASMPASIFMPHARAANQEEVDSIGTPNEVGQHEQPSSSQMAHDVATASSHGTSYAMPTQPPLPATPPVNTEPVPTMPSLPLMFNPSMLSGQAAPAGPVYHGGSGAPGNALHYGQRRQYPRK